ncbi:hypothetical protein NKG94_12540 [Micromonospora sp. M12]
MGVWLLASSSEVATRVIGLWVTGAGLNYAPLSAYAIALMRPGALDAELTGVDTDRELCRYTALQLWSSCRSRSWPSPSATRWPGAGPDDDRSTCRLSAADPGHGSPLLVAPCCFP